MKVFAFSLITNKCITEYETEIVEGEEKYFLKMLMRENKFSF
jgi:hypothetical protein